MERINIFCIKSDDYDNDELILHGDEIKLSTGKSVNRMSISDTMDTALKNIERSKDSFQFMIAKNGKMEKGLVSNIRLDHEGQLCADISYPTSAGVGNMTTTGKFLAKNIRHDGYGQSLIESTNKFLSNMGIEAQMSDVIQITSKDQNDRKGILTNLIEEQKEQESVYSADF